MKKIILFIFLFLTFKCFSRNFPGSGTDRLVGIYMNRTTLQGGDNVGHAGGEEIPVGDIYGLAWFAGGIDVQAGPNDFIFLSTPFPIGKSIAFNDSYRDFLVIVEDMHLSSSVNLLRSGTVEAKFGSIILNGPLNLMGNRITFTGKNSPHFPNFNGKGNIIDFSNGGKLECTPRLFEINDVYLKNVSGDSIVFADRDLSSATLSFTKCTMQLAGDVVFDHDVVIKSGEFFITGTNFTVCFNRKLEIKNGAKLKMDYGTTFSLGYPGYIQTHGTGTIHFNGCDVEIGDNYGSGSEINNGFNLKNGRVLFENRVRINDNNNYKHFIIGEHSQARLLANARVILEGTTTFSLL
ncbi:hypothetical protein GF385_04780 [Candidatus Dependentiae bacterium]|nr:hypothetical protein [Candidatus Dependentiae bacterium]